MAEVMDEASYVKHHKKKIAFLFSAMRHFAAALGQDGYTVRYIRLDDGENSGSLEGEVERALEEHDIDRLIVTEPGEHRLLEIMQGWEERFNLKVEIRADDRFFATHKRFEDWANDGRKQLTMEYFYRELRRETGFLMEGDHPAGGKWNYDKDNRKALPKNHDVSTFPMQFTPDDTTKEVITLVNERFEDHFGNLSEDNFWYAVETGQARRALSHFVTYALPNFGDYQDAMQTGEPFIYHSLLSHYMNAGLLHPREVCEAVEEAYRDGHVEINAAEGYIRQILGWREFIRGVYWLHMPGYTERNALQASRPLPDFYWNGKTKMNCISQVVKMTQEEAYSHHIQRLMVTGNFALLAGLNPQEVHEWYLAVYHDAYEWVEAPNTIGMALYADGGIIGTKPYIASGSYINKMSNFCKSCAYNVSKKTGEEACPFNYLYWDFMARHEKRFKDNQRMRLAYNNLHKKEDSELKEMRENAKRFLDSL